MLVGRERELSIARRALDELAAGSGAGLFVTGEAGVGKSHVLGTIADAARTRDFAVRIGRCFAEPAPGSFSSFRDALGDRALGGGPNHPSLGPQEDRARAFESVLQTLTTQAGEKPLLLAIEDLHWADRDSVSMFLHVARFALAHRVLLVGTVRTPDLDGARNPALDDALAELTRDRRWETMALRPFTTEETSILASEVAGGDVPQAVVRALHDETGGNALYVRELVRYLVEEGKLKRHGDHLSTDFATAELGLPPTIRHVVRQRLARLTPATVTLVRCASAAEGAIDLATLAAACETTNAAALDSVDEAIAAGLVRTSGRGYEPAHAVVRRAIYEELNPDRRALLHRRIATALASAASADPAEIAMHYHASRSLAGAEAGIAHAMRAADAARAIGGHAAAAVLLGLAAELAAGADARTLADVESQRARAYAEALDHERATSAVAAAESALERAGARDAIAPLLANVAEALESGGASSLVWGPLVRRGLAANGLLRDATWARLVRVARELVPVVDGPVFVSRFAPIDPDARRILRAGSERDYAMTVDLHDGHTPEETRDLVARATSWSDAAATIRVLDACARDVFFRDVDMRETQRIMEDVLARSERVGSMSGQVAALVVLGCCFAPCGELVRARDALERARALSMRLGAMHRMKVVGPLALETMLAYFERSPRPDVAAKLVAFASSPEAGKTPFGIVALGLGILGSAIAGDVETVERLIPFHVRALDRLPPELNEWGAGRDCGATATWWLRLDDHAAAYLAFSKRDVARAGSAAWSTPTLSEARMTALVGDVEHAARLFEAARTQLRASGRAPCAAIANYDEARMYVLRGGDPARTSSAIDAAVASCTTHGLDGWTAAAEALRAPTAERPDGLTAREVEVLQLLAKGLANKEIGAKLFISVPTVERHVANIYGKIGGHGRAVATAYAIRKGLVPA